MGIDITGVHDVTGEIVTALGDRLEIAIPQQAWTRLEDRRLEEVQV
jgi:hypothetical protein